MGADLTDFGGCAPGALAGRAKRSRFGVFEPSGARFYFQWAQTKPVM